MSAIQIRPVMATDLPHLMGIDHSASSEYVWQLELRHETGQIVATLSRGASAAPHPTHVSARSVRSWPMNGSTWR